MTLTDRLQLAQAAREIGEGCASITRLRALLEQLQIEAEKMEDRARPAQPGRAASARLVALKQTGRL